MNSQNEEVSATCNRDTYQALFLTDCSSGYGISMLKLLADAHPTKVAQLCYQYRMNAEICQFSNDLVYNGALKCGNDAIRDQMLDLQGFPENIAHEWLRKILDPTSPVVFVNTDPSTGQAFTSLEHIQAGKIVNDTEAKLVTTLISSLLACGVRADSIGVICPFRAQVSRTASWSLYRQARV